MKYGRRNKGGRIEFDDGKPIITEKLYNKTWFPFWRFFAIVEDGAKYYIKDAFLTNEAKMLKERQIRSDNWKTKLNAAEQIRRDR